MQEQNQNEGTRQRRSQRVVLRMRVSVGGRRRPFIEETHTLVISAHGALLAMKTAVEPNELLWIENPQTGLVMGCRVASLRKDDGTDIREVGIEFEHPDPKFWKITFPPSDWLELEDTVEAQ